MGGFGQALADKKIEEGIDIGARKEQKDRIEMMLRKGKSPEQIADFCDYPISLVREVEKSMLVTS